MTTAFDTARILRRYFLFTGTRSSFSQLRQEFHCWGLQKGAPRSQEPYKVVSVNGSSLRILKDGLDITASINRTVMLPTSRSYCDRTYQEEKGSTEKEPCSEKDSEKDSQNCRQLICHVRTGQTSWLGFPVEVWGAMVGPQLGRWRCRATPPYNLLFDRRLLASNRKAAKAKCPLEIQKVHGQYQCILRTPFLFTTYQSYYLFNATPTTETIHSISDCDHDKIANAAHKVQGIEPFPWDIGYKATRASSSVVNILPLYGATTKTLNVAAYIYGCLDLWSGTVISTKKWANRKSLRGTTKPSEPAVLFEAPSKASKEAFLVFGKDLKPPLKSKSVDEVF